MWEGSWRTWGKGKNYQNAVYEKFNFQQKKKKISLWRKK